MNISRIFVAALLLTAGGAAAQKEGGMLLTPGRKATTDGNTFNTSKMSPDANGNHITGGGLHGGNPGGKNPNQSNKPNNGGQPATSAIKLSGVTGTVQIKTAGGTMTVKAGEPSPDIPSGAEIVVVNGDADVSVGGVTVKAGAGDSFKVDTSGPGAVTIGVTGGIVEVVGANGAKKDFASGESTTLSTAPQASKPVTSTIRQADQKAPDSIPGDSDPNGGNVTTTIINVPPSSPTQEKATTTSTCVNTVSPSAPCP